METPTKNLINDHIHIVRLLDVIEALAKQENPNIDHIEEAVSLVKNFADIFHHSKEENMLFPFLSTKGFSAKQGPVAVMLSEHVQGRDYIKNIELNLKLFKSGNELALIPLKDNMMGYSILLRNHILKENNILFPMADRVLNDEDNVMLMKKFHLFESESYCKGLMGNCLTRLVKLAEQYNL